MRVFHVEDIIAYIHCKLESIRDGDIGLDLDKFYNDDKTFKLFFEHLANMNILQYIDYEEFDEKKWIIIVLSKIHDDMFG